jgi:hypothetical protein
VTAKLSAGETLPSITLNLVGGDTLRVPEDLASDFGVVLFYRGHW